MDIWIKKKNSAAFFPFKYSDYQADFLIETPENKTVTLASTLLSCIYVLIQLYYPNIHKEALQIILTACHIYAI